MGVKDAFKKAFYMTGAGRMLMMLDPDKKVEEQVEEIFDAFEVIGTEAKEMIEIVTDLFSILLDEITLDYFIIMMSSLPTHSLNFTRDFKTRLDAIRSERALDPDVVDTALVTTLDDTETDLMTTELQEGGAGGGGSTEPVERASILLHTASPPVVNEERISDKVKVYRTIHIAVSLVISIISIIVEVFSAGQIDKIVEVLSVLYNLSNISLVYNQTMGIDTETALVRPYRYMSESKNLTAIPPLTDLITMLTREQLADDPEESMEHFTRLLSYFGYNEFWASAYWGSHWILPATQELFAMYGRGIITLEELKKQVVINDIHPDWVDRIVALSERIPSRTEGRMMMRTRKLTSVQLDTILDAERVRDDFKADFKYFLENQELDTLRLQIAREYNEQYEKGYILVSDLKLLLANIPFSEAEFEELSVAFADVSIYDSPYSMHEIMASEKLARIKKETKTKDLYVDALKRQFIWQFKQGLSDRDVTQEELGLIIRDIELLDATMDNLMSRVKAEFDVDVLGE